MDSSQLLPKLKNFVKSEEHILTNSKSTNKTIQTSRETLYTGAEIREFYENSVGKGALETQKEVKSKKDIKAKPLKPISSKTRFNFNLFMKAVELGKVDDVQASLEANQERLNCEDEFGWTPLMSACCVGNLPMVQHLLLWNPNLYKRDKRGLNCRDLAFIKGHHHIVDAIDRYIIGLQKPQLINKEQFISNKTEYYAFYCKVCKQNVENTPLKKHLSSTIHNFHSSCKQKFQTIYGIPESNKGFQILVKSGWDKESGLGPSGGGHKYPPKTILKQDRTGLGAKKYKPRVTHTLQETKLPTNKIITNKRDFKYEMRKEQRIERELRRQLS